MENFRAGIGYDVHRIVGDKPLILGGVHIPWDKGLLGHSDADVLIHAICDALLGAAALGDIGTHFPDTDPQYSGISSLLLLERIGAILREKGYRVHNIDSTVVAQKPRISPHIPLMRKRISSALGIDTDSVSIKATTTEGLGFVGNGEGISAYAVAGVVGGE